jgi:hypothetical protein
MRTEGTTTNRKTRKGEKRILQFTRADVSDNSTPPHLAAPSDDSKRTRKHTNNTEKDNNKKEVRKQTRKLTGGGGLRGSIRTTDESTLGGGRKLFLETWRQRQQKRKRERECESECTEAKKRRNEIL